MLYAQINRPVSYWLGKIKRITNPKRSQHEQEILEDAQLTPLFVMQAIRNTSQFCDISPQQNACCAESRENTLIAHRTSLTSRLSCDNQCGFILVCSGSDHVVINNLLTEFIDVFLFVTCRHTIRTYRQQRLHARIERHCMMSKAASYI